MASAHLKQLQVLSDSVDALNLRLPVVYSEDMGS